MKAKLFIPLVFASIFTVSQIKANDFSKLPLFARDSTLTQDSTITQKSDTLDIMKIPKKWGGGEVVLTRDRLSYVRKGSVVAFVPASELKMGKNEIGDGTEFTGMLIWKENNWIRIEVPGSDGYRLISMPYLNRNEYFPYQK